MDTKLENLIEKIKKEGVEQAKKEAKEIIDMTKAKAAKILEDANVQADKTVASSRQQAEQFKKNADIALSQAARDLVLNLKEKLVGVFDAAFKREVQTALSPEFIKEVIIKIVKAWKPKNEQTLEVILSSDDAKKLQELGFSQIKKELNNEVVIKTSANVSKGFRIGIKGEEMYYDFSDESILESLKDLISPALARILDGNG